MSININWGKSMTIVVEVVPGVREQELDALRNELKTIARDNRVALGINTFISDNKVRLAIDVVGVIEGPVQSMITKRFNPKLFSIRQNLLYNNA